MRSWLLILLFAVSGCAGYKLGPTNGVSPQSRSVQFKPFVNRTEVPRISEYLSTSLRKVLQQDGTYRLETSGSPDIIVSGEIVKFTRSGLAFDPNDVLTPQEYTLTIQAHIVATDVATGKVFINRTVQGFTYLRLQNDEFSEERQAIPLLTDNLAHSAVSLLADGPW